jgi:CRP/FNR family transcriptional regulator, cyclic AMP receptor protein
VSLHRDSKVGLLKTVPLFARCSAKELRRIAAIADEVHLPEGKELTRQGTRGREFFILLDGTVDVRKNGRKLNMLGQGDFLGEIALLTQSPRTATATATSPVTALVVTAREFRSLIRDSPAIQLKVLLALAGRLAADAL